MSQGPPVPSAPSVVQRARQANVSEFLKKSKNRDTDCWITLVTYDFVVCFCLAFAAARDIPCSRSLLVDGFDDSWMLMDRCESADSLGANVTIQLKILGHAWTVAE